MRMRPFPHVTFATSSFIVKALHSSKDCLSGSESTATFSPPHPGAITAARNAVPTAPPIRHHRRLGCTPSILDDAACQRKVAIARFVGL